LTECERNITCGFVYCFPLSRAGKIEENSGEPEFLSFEGLEFLTLGIELKCSVILTRNEEESAVLASVEPVKKQIHWLSLRMTTW
jgi:hypothetical protein